MKSMKVCLEMRLLSFLTISLFLVSSTHTMLSCKKAILRSFGMTGNEVANKNNALCPGNKHNCCTNLDQMKVHKLWQKHTKNLIIGNHKINSGALGMLAQVVKDRKEMDIPTLYKEYKKIAKPTKFFEKKFEELEKKWTKHTFDSVSKASKALKEAIKEFKKNVLHYRKGFMCALCDQSSHLYINPEDNSVTYSAGFCMHLIKQNIATLKLKYVDLWDYLMVIAKILNMMTEEAFFSPDGEKYYENFIPIIDKCSTSNDLKSCSPLCLEFNLNKFTNIWDGEKIPIENFLSGYNKVWPKLKDKANWNTMFVFNKKRWDDLEKEEKEKEEAAKKAAKAAQDAKKGEGDKAKDDKKDPEPTKVTIDDTQLKAVRKNSYKIQSQPNSISGNGKKLGLDNVPGADDEAGEYLLFKMSPRPIKVSTLITKIESVGQDLHTVASGNNLETSPEHIIALIFSKGAEIKPLNEPITDDVRAILDATDIDIIRYFDGDVNLTYDRYITKKPRKSTLRPKRSILGIKWGEDEKKKADKGTEDKGAEDNAAPANASA